jgi:hypothetical protein
MCGSDKSFLGLLERRRLVVFRLIVKLLKVVLVKVWGFFKGLD